MVAKFGSDMEVVSTLINDGVDMNAIIHEVCIANSYSCFCVSVLMHVIILSVIMHSDKNKGHH